MRKDFAAWMETYAAENPEVIFLTGDLGYMSLERVRDRLGERFINVGVCEQNMISLAAGLAREGLRPVCYSIAPFAVFRPAEQIRLDVCLHNLDVKIIGNGGGYGYGIMGATHHAIEDIAFLSSLQNMRCYLPTFDEDVPTTADAMMSRTGPGYLRLNQGKKPGEWSSPSYAEVRKWVGSQQEETLLTVVALGPLAIQAQLALNQLKVKACVDLFSVSEMPLASLPDNLLDSIRRSGRLLVVEEHVRRGGLAEHLALSLMMLNVFCKIESLAAEGYPNGLYGSQAYHQRLSGIDSASIAAAVTGLLK